MNISLPSKSSNFSGRNRHKQIIIYYDMVKEKKDTLTKISGPRKSVLGENKQMLRKCTAKEVTFSWAWKKKEFTEKERRHSRKKNTDMKIIRSIQGIVS